MNNHASAAGDETRNCRASGGVKRRQEVAVFRFRNQQHGVPCQSRVDVDRGGTRERRDRVSKRSERRLHGVGFRPVTVRCIHIRCVVEYRHTVGHLQVIRGAKRVELVVRDDVQIVDRGVTRRVGVVLDAEPERLAAQLRHLQVQVQIAGHVHLHVVHVPAFDRVADGVGRISELQLDLVAQEGTQVGGRPPEAG